MSDLRVQNVCLILDQKSLDRVGIAKSYSPRHRPAIAPVVYGSLETGEQQLEV